MLAARALKNNFEAARRIFGLSIVYRRGTQFIELAVAVGHTQTETIDTEGVTVQSWVRDYLVCAAELILDGQVVRPEAGDTIEHWVGSVKMTHEVRPISEGDKVWHWHDAAEQTLRIHTRTVKA